MPEIEKNNVTLWPVGTPSIQSLISADVNRSDVISRSLFIGKSTTER
jgi:hypothetical protein